MYIYTYICRSAGVCLLQDPAKFIFLFFISSAPRRTSIKKQNVMCIIMSCHCAAGVACLKLPQHEGITSTPHPHAAYQLKKKNVTCVLSSLSGSKTEL